MLPPYVSRAHVLERLAQIFPEGTPNRVYCTRELAASTVFTALYIGAIEGNTVYLGPKHVYRMTHEQAAIEDAAARIAYRDVAKPSGAAVAGTRWYADNTREPIRDETLREGLVAIGAVTTLALPTTSGKPRYTLKREFAALFAPDLIGDDLAQAISAYRSAHLSPGALARVSIMLAGAGAGDDGVLVAFPNGETRRLAPGPSSIIAKGVIEVFAPRFLGSPAILWLSESGNKVVARDDRLAQRIGLQIEADKNLPDIILVDLAPAEPLLVFVEVVATDGAITERRQRAIHELTQAAGFDRGQIAFVTAYRDRESSGFRKTVSSIAWGSYAWFVSEPDHLIVFSGKPIAIEGA
ncbi:BsuBI/PstI family type II restriction endonuclease [Novosphingobium acidiphilum]|uniref:BsuBI/PstI family type II restriction endonuclease n=1 Tax=Novosphingobium acidiphilum TaxID=505248 RepID=UPI0005668A7B|nr:BsuBI/PstI family type II restriction endonuclease [Novosphingobium acidiphilum]